MADCKKYDGNTWEHSLRKLTTATDTITTLPVDVYADGNNATVGISGNTVQNGTPTPENPIMPQGCGNMTANFFNQNDFKLVTVTAASDVRCGTIMGVLPQGIYTFNATKSVNAPTIYLTKNTNGSYSYSSIGAVPYTFRADGTSEYMIRISEPGAIASWAVVGYTDMIVNTGPTKKPYEPYGYKIPISSANTTTPVYLGEVPTTRRIKKLVLDGTEEWQNYGQVPNTYRLSISNTQSIGNPAICSHFVNSPISEIASGKFTVGSTWIHIRYADVADLADFKSYLAQQYAAGTPVIIWYVLATETTGIVNEPIRKIGDYADEVSGITIPTIAGADSFDVETTLKPSEVSLTYTGWHDATVKEWDGSQWN